MDSARRSRKGNLLIIETPRTTVKPHATLEANSARAHATNRPRQEQANNYDQTSCDANAKLGERRSQHHGQLRNLLYAL